MLVKMYLECFKVNTYIERHWPRTAALYKELRTMSPAEAVRWAHSILRVRGRRPGLGEKKGIAKEILILAQAEQGITPARPGDLSPSAQVIIHNHFVPQLSWGTKVLGAATAHGFPCAVDVWGERGWPHIMRLPENRPQLAWSLLEIERDFQEHKITPAGFIVYPVGASPNLGWPPETWPMNL